MRVLLTALCTVSILAPAVFTAFIIWNDGIGSTEILTQLLAVPFLAILLNARVIASIWGRQEINERQFKTLAGIDFALAGILLLGLYTFNWPGTNGPYIWALATFFFVKGLVTRMALTEA
jgi:hypothetical protein